MARFGEHGLTWLQSVDRGPALTVYVETEQYILETCATSIQMNALL